MLIIITIILLNFLALSSGDVFAAYDQEIPIEIEDQHLLHVETTLETSGEDVKLHSKRVEKM